MLPNPQKKPNNLGSSAESLASDILVKNGYKVLTRNFRSKFGEIDIVALKDDTLIFVEVKARQSLKFGSPEEAVTPSKLRKIEKTGQYFSFKNPNLPKKLRVEVIAIVSTGGEIESYKIIKVF